LENLQQTLALILATASLSILLFDLKQRAKEKRDLASAKEEAEKAAQALSELHNKQIAQLAELNSKVSAHEMLIKAHNTNNNVMKRF